MESVTPLLAIILGVLLRLAIPILGTLILIYFLRKLDAHWQAEAQLAPELVEKVECWKVKGCSEEQRSRGHRQDVAALVHQQLEQLQRSCLA